jgi:hypothetical protein
MIQETWLPSRYLAMDGRSDSDIPAFRQHVTESYKPQPVLSTSIPIALSHLPHRKGLSSSNALDLKSAGSRLESRPAHRLHTLIYFSWLSSVLPGKCWKNTVAYRPVAKRWLCKQRPLLGNARNIHARNNRRTVFSMWSVPRCYNREVLSLVQLSSAR